MKFSMFSASFEAHPLLASFYIISRIKVFVKNFFSTFWGVFSVHFHASQCLVYDVVFVRACLPDSLIILPKIRPLVNAFFYLFFFFFAHPFLPLQLCPFQPFFVFSECFLSKNQAVFCGRKRPNKKYKISPVKLNKLKNRYTPFAPKWSSRIPPKNWQQMVLRLLPIM